MDDLNINKIKEGVIIIALDNLASLCEKSLEMDEITKEEREYFTLLSSLSREIISERGGELNKPHVIPRPKWE